MNKLNTYLSNKLAEKSLISNAELEEINSYRNKEIFSLHNELLSFIYISILLFTSGIGILIYNNIDSIGHIAILSLNLMLMVVCFYFSVKKTKSWSKQEVLFENPIYDYIVLLGSILVTIFIGYLQFQYNFFGTTFGLSALITAFLSFGIAYFFDNKSVLSIALTALTTSIGITLTPKTLLENDIYNNIYLTYSGLALGICIILWNIYCEKQNLKKHFNFVFLTFALHLSGISIISGLLSKTWYVFIVFLVGFGYYFYHISKKIKATSLFVFALIYTYVGINILLFKLFENIDFPEFLSVFFMVIPFYFIGSIVLFFKLVIEFNKEKNDSLQ
jgi:hypothetical protein